MGLSTTAAGAQDKLKIGIIATLSGPPAVLGQQLRNGFQLAVKDLGGKLGGREVEVIVQDDELKPDVAVTKVKALVERDKVDFVVGPIFSNILAGDHEAGDRRRRHPDQPECRHLQLRRQGMQSELLRHLLPERPGLRRDRASTPRTPGMKKVFLMAPNYQAGKDALAGFKRFFKGEIADEVYVPLDQLDYSAELAKIAAAKPDAIFVFLPGGMGVNFVKQFRQAGLADKIKFLSAFTVDESTLPAQQDAALGFFGGANWAPNLDNPQNKKFVAGYEKEFNAVPATYAFQAYDAALLIDGALKLTKGNTADKDALRAALMKADFKSLRGGFKFNTNHYPIQDFYLVKVAKRADGKFQTEIVKKVFTNYADPHAKDCPMK